MCFMISKKGGGGSIAAWLRGDRTTNRQNHRRMLHPIKWISEKGAANAVQKLYCSCSKTNKGNLLIIKCPIIYIIIIQN